MKSEYALRATMHLALTDENKYVNIPAISSCWRIPEKFLRKIIPQLRKAGIIKSQRGINGGISLAISPADITVLDVIEAIDGKLKLNKCLAESFECSFKNGCAYRQLWHQVQENLTESLQSKSIMQLAREQNQKMEITP
jgi:Rrf2 family protein